MTVKPLRTCSYLGDNQRRVTLSHMEISILFSAIMLRRYGINGVPEAIQKYAIKNGQISSGLNE